MSTAEPTSEAQNLSYMAPTTAGLLALLGRDEDVLRAVLARARFDDQAALKRVCKRFLAVITSRAFREERRASGCLEHTVLVDGEGAFARKSFAGLPCGGPGGMAWGLATLG